MVKGSVTGSPDLGGMAVIGLKHPANKRARKQPDSKQLREKRRISFAIFIQNSLKIFPAKGHIEAKDLMKRTRNKKTGDKDW
jgi:hypothetical protein